MKRPHYFSGKVSGGFVSIYSSKIITGISSALMGLFLPIFLFEALNLNLSHVLIYCLIDYSLYGLLVCFGARFSLNKLGIKKSIIVSVFFGAIFYLVLFLMTEKGASFGLTDHNLYLMLGLTILFINLNRWLYWVPMHTDLTKFTDKDNRVREMSFLEATLTSLRAIVPFFGGWILLEYGYNVLFLMTIFIYFSSIFPLLRLPKTEERFSWTYGRTWKEFFSKKRRKTVLAFMGDGAENVVSGTIWPIFIWQLLNGNYFTVGAISSLIVLATIALQLAVGRFADLGKRDKILRWGTILYSVGWVVKIFIETAFQIFVISTYHNLTRIFTRAPFDALNYQKAADQGHYVDEYTVIHEMALMFGRIVVILVMLALIPIFGIAPTFILAALSTLLMNFLIDSKTVEAIEARVG